MSRRVIAAWRPDASRAERALSVGFERRSESCRVATRASRWLRRRRRLTTFDGSGCSRATPLRTTIRLYSVGPDSSTFTHSLLREGLSTGDTADGVIIGERLARCWAGLDPVGLSFRSTSGIRVIAPRELHPTRAAPGSSVILHSALPGADKRPQHFLRRPCPDPAAPATGSGLQPTAAVLNLGPQARFSTSKPRSARCLSWSLPYAALASRRPVCRLSYRRDAARAFGVRLALAPSSSTPRARLRRRDHCLAGGLSRRMRVVLTRSLLAMYS